MLSINPMQVRKMDHSLRAQIKTTLQEIVQPRILEQVVACKDDIAQQYLMQCLIQGFPDEFHLASLEVLLGTLPQLQLGVKVHIILSSLLDRLGR